LSCADANDKVMKVITLDDDGTTALPDELQQINRDALINNYY